MMPTPVPPGALDAPDTASAEVYRFDRRLAPRRPSSGRATLVLDPAPDSGIARRLVGIDLRDASEAGLAGFVRTAVDTLATVRVIVHRRPGRLDDDRHAHVVRCDRIADGSGYDLAVRFDDPTPAA